MDNTSLIKIDKRRFNIVKIILILVVFVILFWFFAITIVSSMVKNKIAKIEVENLDINQIGINNNLYDELYGAISKEEFDSIINIVLLIVDKKKSNTVMIATVNQTKHTIKLISVPADTYVSVKEHDKMSISDVYTYGQETLMLNTINTNFGLNISKYVTVNFEEMKDVINEINGIELNITQEEMEYINANSDELYKEEGKETKLLNNFGEVTLDGEQALIYSRYINIDEEITGKNRQLDVIISLGMKIGKVGTSEIWRISDSIFSKLKTNLNIKNFKKEAEKILSYSSQYISSFVLLQIPSTEEKYGNGKKEEIDGKYYFVVNLDETKEASKNKIYIENN